jgi:Ca2+-binding EF-hand superfamily protein
MVSGIGSATSAFSAQDLAAMREKMFKKADTDGDGKISKAEMQAAAPKDGKGPNVDELFSKVDTDGDGYITDTEDKAAAEKMQKAGPPARGPRAASQMAKAIFKDADGNGDGSITADDLANILPKDGNGPDAKELFKAADSDSDGKISQADLEKALKAMMKRQKGAEATAYTASGVTANTASSSSVISVSA